MSWKNKLYDNKHLAVGDVRL